MKKDFERLDKLLRTRAYEQLTEEEQAWVLETVGVEAYNELSKLVSGLASEKERPTSKRVKTQLIREFRSKHRVTAWYEYRIPAYVNMMLVVAVGLVVWFFAPPKEVIIERQELVEVPIVETITIELPGDTVFIERPVRVEVPVYITQEIPEEIVVQPSSKAKSLRESKALSELLVSGVD